MSILPQTGQTVDPEQLKPFREWAYNFTDGHIDGPNARLLEGNEALKVWIYKALRTETERYTAYTDGFGSTIEDLLGESLQGEELTALAEVILRAALLQSAYILDVRDVSTSMDESGKHGLSCNVETVYGLIEVGVTI